MDLEKIELDKAISAVKIDKKLNGLKWISPIFPDNPDIEIRLLKETIKLIKEDQQNKILITHYQFISAIINQPIFSPARTYATNNTSYPTEESKFFESYKSFFNNQIEEKKIQVIYLIKPLKEETITDFIDKSCYTRINKNEILIIFKIKKC